MQKSKFTAYLLNIFTPGLGHIYWKEYLFGIFVFLIMMLAVILVVVSFFISLDNWVIWMIAILPVIFYLFTFFDLSKSISKKKTKLITTKRKAVLFLIAGILYQLLVPLAPANFIIRNFPEYFIVERNDLNPVFQEGNILKASRLSYFINIFFIDKPVLYNLPNRYDIIRFESESGQKKVGIVIGLSGEEIEMAEGVVVVNGLAVYNQPSYFTTIGGECQLTYVDQYSILVGKLNLGMVNSFELVPFNQLIGKVDKVF